jgi:hypothetical protein
VRALILAAINPDNTPHGYNWTMVFPMLLFAVIALVLWALFGRPHQRVPARRVSPGLISAPAGAQASSAAPETGAGTEDSGQPPAGGPGANQ